MMDALCTRAVEEYVGAGLPLDAAAVLLVEVVGEPFAVDEDARRIADIGRSNGARDVRVAADDDERALLWKGRKTAFGAVARIKPNLYLHDTVVPRHRLTEVLDEVYAVADRYDLLVMNVFHAGDGNLHPLLVFDARDPGVLDRVHAAGEEIVRISVAAGGVLSGEHGIGWEKRDLMPLMFDEVDLQAQDALRRAFDPDGVANPTKVLPSGSRCGDLQSIPGGAWI
jgi:glycolate oxidase